MKANLIGQFFCCACHGDTPTQRVWMVDGTRRALCREHFTAEHGEAPPDPREADTLPLEPHRPLLRWIRTGVDRWRALRETDGGVRLDHVRNDVVDVGTIADHGVRFNPAQWVHLVLALSGFADASLPEQECARHMLWRLHKGEQ